VSQDASSDAAESPSQYADTNVTNIDLLQQTRQYLQTLLQRQAPDTMLAHAWDEFYRIYSALVRRFVLARGLRGADVDDCVQDVWSTVARKLSEFERPSARPGLRAWLYTVVRSKATDFVRRGLRQPVQNLEAAVDRDQLPDHRAADPAAAVEQQWEQALLQTALDELRARVSELSYRVLELRVLEGRSEAETAAALNLQPEQVRYRKYRTQRKLQAILAVYTGDDFG
jgi:RNA polymerase sigma-70 factor (ECF subfamily)